MTLKIKKMIKIVQKQENLAYKKIPILASQAYLKIKSDNYGWLVNDNYILPYFLDTRLIFTRMVFTYGLIAKKDNLSIGDEKEFLDDMVTFVKQNKLCDFIYKAQSNVVFNTFPKDSDAVEWGTYLVDLSLSEEDLLKSFHGKHRNVVKNAIKNKVIIEETNDVNLAYNCISDTLIRQGSIHYPSLEYIKNLVENIDKNVLILKAVKEEVVQGVVIIIYDNNMGYYMYGGSIKRPFTGSLNLLQYEAMKILKSRNVKFYDFVGARINVEKGSKYEGLQRFKSRFGAELVKGYAFRTIVNPLKFKLFNFISRLYLKIKGYEYIDPIESILKSGK